jgi:hypothetical protein
MKHVRKSLAVLTAVVVASGSYLVIGNESRSADALPATSPLSFANDSFKDFASYGTPPADLGASGGIGNISWRPVVNGARGTMAVGPKGEALSWDGGRGRYPVTFAGAANGAGIWEPAGIVGAMNRWSYGDPKWNGSNEVFTVDNIWKGQYDADKYLLFVSRQGVMLGVAGSDIPTSVRYRYGYSGYTSDDWASSDQTRNLQAPVNSDFHVYRNYATGDGPYLPTWAYTSNAPDLGKWQAATSSAQTRLKVGSCIRNAYTSNLTAEYGQNLAWYEWAYGRRTWDGFIEPNDLMKACMDFGPVPASMDEAWGGFYTSHSKNFDGIEWMWCPAGGAKPIWRWPTPGYVVADNTTNYTCPWQGWVVGMDYWNVYAGTALPPPANAVADSITVGGGQTATIDVLANDGGTTGKSVASTGGSPSNGSVSWSGSNLTFTGSYSTNTVFSSVTYTLASGSSTTVTLILLGQGSPSVSVNVTATPGSGQANNCSRFAPPDSALRQVPGSATPSWSPTFSYPLYTGVSGSVSGSGNYLYGAPVAVANSQSLLTPSGTETVGGVTYGDYSVSNGTFRYLPRPNVRQYSSNAALLMQGDNPTALRPSPFALWFNQQFDVPVFFPDGTYVGTQRITSNAFVGSYISAAVCPSKPEGNVVTVTVDPNVIRAGSTSVSLTSASSDAIFSQTLLNVWPADRPKVPSSRGSVSFAGNVMTFTPARNLRGINDQLGIPYDIPFKVTNPDGIVGDATLRIIYTAMPSNAT